MTIRLLISLLLLFSAELVFANNEEECSNSKPILCVERVYEALEEGAYVTFKDIVLITYYGELSILDNTPHRKVTTEALVRNIYDSQSGLVKCYQPLVLNVFANSENIRQCIYEFLATSQHWRDSIKWSNVNNEWIVNLDRLTGEGRYLGYTHIMEQVVNPEESWKTGQSYTRPSIWGNTTLTEKADIPKDMYDEIFLWINYSYKGCEYSFFVATIEVRNLELNTCEQES